MTARADIRSLDLGDASTELATATLEYILVWHQYSGLTVSEPVLLAHALQSLERARRELVAMIPDDYGLWRVGSHRVGRLKVRERGGISKVVRPYGRHGPVLD